jgi:uncharacterized membrane protein (UPF0127 family)
MLKVRVINRTRDIVLAEHAELADNLWTRFVGLMGRTELPRGGGLVLKPGGGIHMWFMRMPLDVIHVDQHDRVTHVLRGIKPWRFGPLFVGGKLAIELAVGVADGTQIGDQIDIERVQAAP